MKNCKTRIFLKSYAKKDERKIHFKQISLFKNKMFAYT